MVKIPVCVWSEKQTAGIGSKNNKWEGVRGNLFFSFAYEIDFFPKTPMESYSLYFGWIFKKTLNSLGSKAIMKWPNDIYLIEEKPKKIGGVITNIRKNALICGIGLNTKRNPSEEFGRLDIDAKNDKILTAFFKELEKKPKFEDIIFSYKKEFEKTKKFFYEGAFLDDDGALIKNGKKVYSER
jgi:BirA family biotin operon repressor/biotin-[acetyl-CoA-carboxylase] ligase